MKVLGTLQGKQKGLTLVELLVVVAVISILAGIAYPIYTSQADKSRRTDGRVAAATIAAAQERFHSIQGRYTSNLGSLSIDTGLQSGNSGSRYYSLAVAASTNTFTVTVTPAAGGPQVGDSCSAMTIDETGNRSGTGSHCW